ncbi:MAG: hypothetical protein ABT02_10275 [Comamonadaceae bacterium SCN 68-20]|nr:LuxR family transcriptional regulator [Comamonadaceae bacterium]ODU59403.1 MAG: hypothetical protein ABT02_10275 [Comamonadaceae bacterium SCN 68-20]OJX33593.1 MAG: hypothetical protein BGO75_02230 [Burkholderiales bacterium 68-20]
MAFNPLYLVEEVATARNAAELRTAIQRAASRLGFDTYCFGMFYNEPGSGEPQYFSIDNYRPGWAEHYTRSGYQELDVAVTHCAGHTTPLVWTRKLYDTPQLKHLEEEGLAQGIDGGVTLPVHSPWLIGMGGLLLASAEHADRVAARAADFVATGQLLACHVAQAVRNLDLLPASMAFRPTEELTPREAECLQWAASGLPAQAIAQRMGISVATVNSFFLPAIRRKLGVASTLEAVSLAFRHRLIRL